MNTYWRWIAANDSTYHLGASGAVVKAKRSRLLEQSRRAPLAGKLGPDEWTDAFLSAGYHVYGWEDLADAFVAATKGDFDPRVEQYDGANGAGPGSDDTYAVYKAVQCTDVQWPTRWQRRIDRWRTYAKAPFETWANPEVRPHRGGRRDDARRLSLRRRNT